MSSVPYRLDGRRKRAEKLAVLWTAALISLLFTLLGCAASKAAGPGGSATSVRMTTVEWIP